MVHFVKAVYPIESNTRRTLVELSRVEEMLLYQMLLWELVEKEKSFVIKLIWCLYYFELQKN